MNYWRVKIGQNKIFLSYFPIEADKFLPSQLLGHPNSSVGSVVGFCLATCRYPCSTGSNAASDKCQLFEKLFS